MARQNQEKTSWGVVVAADRRVEWLLPWWWECYSRHQTAPVAFIDWGMSQKGRQWCKAHGIWRKFRPPPQPWGTSREQIAPFRQRRWEKIYGPTLWKARPAWFRKPLAMQQTPFQTSIWLDLDCEVCQPIGSLVEGVGKGVLGAVRVEKRDYNSGVIVYDKDSSLLKAWATACGQEQAYSMGDETILSKLIRTGVYPFKEVDRVYNWMMGWGYHPKIKIAHWAASWGKLCIETLGGIQRYSEKILYG